MGKGEREMGVRREGKIEKDKGRKGGRCLERRERERRESERER